MNFQVVCWIGFMRYARFCRAARLPYNELLSVWNYLLFYCGFAELSIILLFSLTWYLVPLISWWCWWIGLFILICPWHMLTSSSTDGLASFFTAVLAYFFTVIGLAWNYCHFAIRIEPHCAITVLTLLDTALLSIMRLKSVFLFTCYNVGVAWRAITCRKSFLHPRVKRVFCL